MSIFFADYCMQLGEDEQFQSQSNRKSKLQNREHYYTA